MAQFEITVDEAIVVLFVRFFRPFGEARRVTVLRQFSPRFRAVQPHQDNDLRT